jgi:hypothetical protein
VYVLTTKKKIALSAVITAVLLMAAASLLYATDINSDDTSAPLELYFFGSNVCIQCLEIKNDILIPLERLHGEKIKIHYHDIDNPESFELMYRLERQFGVTHGSPIELFFPDTVLLGFEPITASARAMIEERLNDPSRQLAFVIDEPAGDINAALRDRFARFTFWAIIVAALIDSVNPCSIASLIFLLSFLAAQKRKRSDILKIGLLFTATVFFTYLMFGVGAFKAIAYLQRFYWVKLFIKWSAVACAGILGIISFVDAFRYKKSGDTKDIKIQLPKKVKLLIHKVITKNLTGKRLIVGTIIAGFLVTVLDAICTVEVYLPVLVLMAQSSDGELKLTGWLYLILYNLIFVTPLLIVMIAAYYGLTWNRLAKMTQRNLTLVKIGLGTVLIGLAVFLAMM